MKYILASKSPRRKQLMRFISSDFEIATEDIDESSSYDLSPIEAVKDIARRKGEAVDQFYPNDLIISADTIVVLDNEIIGKPKDEEDAKRMLRKLSGRTHYVYTGFRIKYIDKEIVDYVESQVQFNNYDDTVIDSYISTHTVLDKAGAYGIQDNGGFPLVFKVTGSIDNVIGFPVKEIKEAIKKVIN